jgi:sugar O-acyltransferase (sialic acid O-acetyltransferase NeuD family)
MVVIGAGGHALEVLDILIQDNYPHPIYFYDDINPDSVIFRGYPVIKSIPDLKKIYPNDFYFILGIGTPKYRFLMTQKFTDIGGSLSSIISSKSITSKKVKENEYDVMNLCYLGPETNIGQGTLINTGAQIHHEVIIGEFCEISPRALLLGKVQIGNNCSLGGNCTILPKVKIGNNVIVGAGTVVTKDIPDNMLVVGVPGEIIKSLE